MDGGELEQRFTRALPLAIVTAPIGGVLAPLTVGNTFEQEDQLHVSGGNILSRWTREFSEDSELSIQAYFDHTLRETIIFEEDRNTFDLDLQHRINLGDRNTLIWGGGYRLTSDEVGNSFDISLSPTERTTHLFSAFIQDEIQLIENLLSLTVGTKFEHNDFTGAELQPNGRMLFTPHEMHNVWLAVSRAVRTPSRAEDDVRLNQMQNGTLVNFFGNRDFQSEVLTAYELGYRVSPRKGLSFDLATFYNDYDDLRSAELVPPGVRSSPFPPHIPFMIENKLEGQTYGAEIAGNWQMLSNLRWHASYTLLETQLRPKNGGIDTLSERNLEGSNPHHQAQVRFSVNLPYNLEFDGGLRYIDRLVALGINDYYGLDLRLGWRIKPNVEFSIVGKDLLDNRHPEFRPTTILTQAAEIQRSVYAKVTFRF